MPSSAFNLRNIAPEVMTLLKQEALRQRVSINTLILQVIERGLGLSRKKKRAVFHDLDELAGTWNSKDKKDFDKAVEQFEMIDKELWK